MALQIEYRPKTLAEVAGNTATVEALKAHLGKRRPNHSLLFTGYSGCGKTTLARVVAAHLGAYDPAKPESKSPDYREMNASDFRGIDMVRDIIQQSQYHPFSGKYIVWFLDECHKLSSDAQEAILKLLEHPPSHVWVLLATTEPNKLKTTLRRRCTEFTVEPLDDEELQALLKTVARKEGKRIQPKLIGAILRECLGSPGLALQLLDKVIDLDADQAKAAVHRYAEQENATIELCRALLAKKPWKSIAQILAGLDKENPETIRYQVLEYFRKVLLSGKEDSYLVMEAFREPFYNTGKAGLVMACYEAICRD